MNHRFFSRARFWGLLALSVALTGCASLQSHDKLASDVHSAGQAQGIPAALARLESSATTESDKTALLYNLERGELLRLDRRYEDSNHAFMLADNKVKEWEEAATGNPQKLMGTVGASLISERLKVYEGQDYEKVWLTTRMALNRVALGDFDNARVDIKRTHEREAVIAEFRAKETLAAEEEAKSKGAASGSKQINGYPVETLNDPEVLALKNGYQNALSHYLAGFMYEAMNEPGLAAPGYRKAIELKPETGVLEEGLRGLDDRSSFTWKRRQRMTDVLFVVEAGDAPARKPKAFTLPVPTGRGLVTASISYPVIEPSSDPLLSQLSVAGYDLKLEKVVDLNAMARRALKDEMPGMVLRGFTRAVAKGVLQDQLQKNAGLLGGLIGAVASAATEQADDRMWRMLPGRVYVARGYLPPGEHRITINGRTLEQPVKVDGQYALVPLRFYHSSVLTGEVATLGQLAAVAAEPPPPAAPAAVAPTAKPQPAAARPARAQAKPAVQARAH
ncbi:hypothetical protein B2J88_48735 [Rhodococcus sp. SRB_17]|uniref:COG3014 family protein n=1 Tax=Acidovorax sp. SRB_24 TaxID=1962700 RepID=UPI00145EDD2E|nr:hypothetical protein [Acidovorax sp. SRB_24]NMM75797.1 hypothetical protein [Acidovorax sp. SRB_24]NMM92061.1 hypothetical protein [Rhodococcus sp. SRB_17]